MKIGLIGINKYAKFLNFACDLHIYAFQQFLTQHGYESAVLDYKPVYHGNFDMRHPVDYAEAKHREALKRTATTPEEIAARKKDVAKWETLAEGYRGVRVERERRFDKFEAFVKKNLVFTEEVYNSDLLKVQDPGFDCYICVTDVIWQSLPRHMLDRGFLLGSKAFEGKQKIAYAASRGASRDFTKREEAAFFGYLEDIDAISVRERDFCRYIEDRSGLAATTVMDPTLLQDKEFWQKVSTKPSQERYVLLYYVMERSTDTIAKAVEYAKFHDLTLVELSDRPFKEGKVTDPDVKHVSRYDVGMEEWLGYIEHADAVFTNSFHGCCFSVLFEKTFFVGSRNGQKVPNFLATFGLDGRRFAPQADVSTFSHEIDYAAVNEILAGLRRESGDFILTALKDAEKRIESGEARDMSAHEEKRRQLAYPVRFHSGNIKQSASLSPEPGIEVKQLKRGAIEYSEPGRRYLNDGTSPLAPNRFTADGYDFAGWTVRFRIDNRWFWCLDDGSVAPDNATGSKVDSRKQLFADQAAIPHLPVNHVDVVVLVAKWRKRGSDRLAPTRWAISMLPTPLRRAGRKVKRALKRLTATRA